MMRRSGLRYLPSRRLSPAWVASRESSRTRSNTERREHQETRLDRFDSDGLSEMAFSHPGRADKKCVALLSDKATGAQFVDPRTIDGSIEGEVKVVQGADLAEIGSFVAPGDGALLSHVEFVLENDFQELMVRKSAGFGCIISIPGSESLVEREPAVSIADQLGRKSRCEPFEAAIGSKVLILALLTLVSCSNTCEALRTWVKNGSEGSHV